MNPRLAHNQVKLLHKYQHAFDILYSLFPRHSPCMQTSLVWVLFPTSYSFTVRGGKDLAIRLFLQEMYASGKS